jgi:hypothetical protein
MLLSHVLKLGDIVCRPTPESGMSHITPPKHLPISQIGKNRKSSEINLSKRKTRLPTLKTYFRRSGNFVRR